MNVDGNTAAIERMMADREEYDERREAEQELQDLRDEVDALVADLTAARAALEEISVSGHLGGDECADMAATALATPQEKADE